MIYETSLLIIKVVSFHHTCTVLLPNGQSELCVTLVQLSDFIKNNG